MSHDEARDNRLAGESSPYLLLHRHNPVDWYPWGEEALSRARREDRPIFLSVGYSTCYWCHVMERESFSDPAVAAAMNRDFVNIKVDREERPDLDEIYMAATQILAGQGGWPNSVFLTPDLKPFFAGTYFPPEDLHGRPSFGTVLAGLVDAWRSRRPEVEEQAEEMARAMRRFLEERASPGPAVPGPGAVARGVHSLARRFDRVWGGFGGAPKFPTPSNLFLLLEALAEKGELGEQGDQAEAGAMLAATLDRMARGGIYDQLGGGFHRYATDREWKVPHFEKMLYDNGLLLEVYAREHARTGSAQAARVARETAAFLAREMTSPEGAFWSAIDAETAGHEGAYYVWTREEIEDAVGPEDAAFAAPLLGFDGDPFFPGPSHRSSYVLHLPDPLEEAARRRRLPLAELMEELSGLRRKLLAVRSARERPATDDKILADWNGTAIAGLAVAAELLDEPELAVRAARAAEHILHEMRPGGGPLLHVWREGRARIPAYLGDYAYLVHGLLALHRTTAEQRWLAAAAELAHEQVSRLRDPQGGFFVAAASPDLLFRSKDPFDGALPSANAVAMLNLLELARRSGDSFWLEEAEAALRAFAPLVEAHPDAVRTMAVAALRYSRLEAGALGGGGRAAATREAGAGFSALEVEAEGLVALDLRVGPRAPVVAPMAAGEGEAPRGPGAEGSDAGRAGGEAAASGHEATGPRALQAGWRPFRLGLEIAPGWHLQANPAGEDFLVATTVAIEGAPAVTLPDGASPSGEEEQEALRHLRYPPGEPLQLGFAQAPLPVYQGHIEIAGELRLPASGRARLLVTYQVCDHSRCLPAVTRRLEVAVP